MSWLYLTLDSTILLPQSDNLPRADTKTGVVHRLQITPVSTYA